MPHKKGKYLDVFIFIFSKIKIVNITYVRDEGMGNPSQISRINNFTLFIDLVLNYTCSINTKILANKTVTHYIND